jgi:hypothetical protein
MGASFKGLTLISLVAGRMAESRKRLRVVERQWDGADDEERFMRDARAELRQVHAALRRATTLGARPSECQSRKARNTEVWHRPR